MTGRRIQLHPRGLFLEKPGDYGRDKAGTWWLWPPVGEAFALAGAYSVTEHSDGTITVEPPIATNSWCGRLVAGEWIEDQPQEIAE